MPTIEDYALQPRDIERVAELSSLEPIERTEVEDVDFPALEDLYPEHSKELRKLMRELGEAALSDDGDAFAAFVAANTERIREAAAFHPEVVELLILGYRLGITSGSSACMNDLGTLYYLGDLVEQDYQKAAELYEMAVEAGCYQSVINLGYIYEYGRLGSPDHVKAFQQYALAAALAPSCEATYKLGDMYSRGEAVERSPRTARALYERSLEMAGNDAEAAQSAIRIAHMIIGELAPSEDAPQQALRALSLYQLAEVGLRRDIAAGHVYYRKRLMEAIEGQKRAREALQSLSAAMICCVD